MDGTQGIGKVLTSDASGNATWQTAVTPNIYNSDGTLTGNRTMTMSGYTLSLNGGNVGIGTTNPVNRLQLGGNLHMVGNSIYLDNTATGYNNFIQYNSTLSRVDISGVSGVDLGYTSGGVISTVLSVNNLNQVTVPGLAGNGTRTIGATAAGVLVIDTVVPPTSNGAAVAYPYTGNNQYFIVPAGVTRITVQLWGAGGGAGYNTSNIGSGGGGGFVSGTLNVTSGEVLTLIVGGGGCNSCTGHAYGGGGAGSPNCQGGSGGGRSAIQRTPGTDLATAGGGGGGTRYNNTAFGGAGGAASGAGGCAGGQGTTSSGGAGGAGSGGSAGTAGSQYQGGDAGGGTGCGGGTPYGGGGGGGGYYGGGGGGQQNSCNTNSGGGGSNYTGGLTTATANTAGSAGNNGGNNATSYPVGNSAGLPSGYSTVGTGASVSSGTGGNGLITISW